MNQNFKDLIYKIKESNNPLMIKIVKFKIGILNIEFFNNNF